MLSPCWSQFVLGAQRAAGDWGGLWFGWGVLGAGVMQAWGLWGLQKSLQTSACWKWSFISLRCFSQALQELMLRGCSGTGEDTCGPFHISLHQGRMSSQDLRSPPWSHPATPKIHPLVAKRAQASQFCQQAPAGYAVGKTRLIY